MLVPGLVLGVVITACGDPADAGGTEDDPRVVEVAALDTLAYEPTTIEVAEGETITFVVSNSGDIDHEFVVGDEETQRMAEEEMAEGMHGHTAAMAALTIAPGDTEEATVTFEEAGTLQYACHIEGHYPGGMVGTIEVS
jgi:uncharacterized cupredoxin-like copper-binding protein